MATTLQKSRSCKEVDEVNFDEEEEDDAEGKGQQLDNEEGNDKANNM